MTFSRVRFWIIAPLIVVVLAANLAAAQISAPQATPLDTLVRAEIAPFKGKVFLFAKNLDTGVSYSFNGDERVRTASTIKVAVMIEAFTPAAEGRAKWTTEFVPTTAAPHAPPAAFSTILTHPP